MRLTFSFFFQHRASASFCYWLDFEMQLSFCRYFLLSSTSNSAKLNLRRLKKIKSLNLISIHRFTWIAGWVMFKKQWNYNFLLDFPQWKTKKKELFLIWLIGLMHAICNCLLYNFFSWEPTYVSRNYGRWQYVYWSHRNLIYLLCFFVS